MSSAPLIAITGVTRGLGRVLADWFSDQEKRVAGCAIKPPTAQASGPLRV
jgi:NAD(P)-dependent dehydrogenase (short-subunit alcohol dehydrogenase family)